MVPVLASPKTVAGRLWAYVRDDRPFGGPASPAVVFAYSRDRGGAHPCRHLAGYAGILQADAYAGFNDLYDPARKPGPIIEAACWAHGRRKLFVLADVAKAPLAVEAVRRIDAIFAVERNLNGLAAAQRLAARQVQVASLVASLEAWMRGERSRLSRHADVAKAMDYMLKRSVAFTRFLADGRICLTNNVAERELRGVALERRAWLFAGADRGGEVTVRSDARLWGIDAAVSGGREGFRFVADEVAAMPGQQIGDAVDRICCDALEEVAQIGFRLDIVEPRSCDQGSDGCSAHATCVGSRKQPVFPTQGDRPDRLLSISMVPSSA